MNSSMVSGKLFLKSQEFDLTINEREKKQNELVYLFIYLFINYLFIINWLIWTDFIQMRYI